MKDLTLPNEDVHCIPSQINKVCISRFHSETIEYQRHKILRATKENQDILISKITKKEITMG